VIACPEGGIRREASFLLSKTGKDYTVPLEIEADRSLYNLASSSEKKP